MKDKKVCFNCSYFFPVKFCEDELFGICSKIELLTYEEKEKLNAYEPACQDFLEKE